MPSAGRDDFEISHHKGNSAKWIQQAPEGACYAIGRVIDHVLSTDETLGASIITLMQSVCTGAGD